MMTKIIRLSLSYSQLEQLEPSLAVCWEARRLLAIPRGRRARFDRVNNFVVDG
ncbi:hypothetical protein HK405_006840 [Cladochytrium tenue]|nr:hypothetical protein HK405_006840 [Cladochytrium tenue]